MQVWDFKGRGLKSRWEIGCSLVKIVYHRPNGNSYVVLILFNLLLSYLSLLAYLLARTLNIQVLKLCQTNFDIIFRSFGYCGR